MASISRRDLFKLGAAAAAGGAIVPRLARAGSNPAESTTLARTIVKGSRAGTGTRGSYYRLAEGAPEPHIVRSELASRAASPVRASLLHFAHFTDIHIVDAQSPARVEFLDREADNQCSPFPVSAAYRAQETLTLHVLEAMIRQIHAIGVSPVTNAPIGFAMCTGDNIDNEQFNELRWFIDLMDGGAMVAAGNSGGTPYEGVMTAAWGDEEYWHPDINVPDKYKREYGFPEFPGLLEASIVPFRASGVGMPWYQTFGNHDGLMQGNVARNDVFEAIAVGSVKVSGPPPGVDPCDSFQLLQSNPKAFLAAPAHAVTADPTRKILRRSEYIEEHFRTTGTPNGHGFTPVNRVDGTAYYTNDSHAGFRLIALDTVNPGGYNDGSIGRAQFNWLLERMREASASYVDAQGQTVNTGNANSLIILFSHHGLRSLNNQVTAPDAREPGANDLPRVLASEIEAAVHRFPNVIAWVNGHSHTNTVVPRRGATGGFWDIGTAAHIDWNSQSRLIEVVDNADGTLSILCTMVDHSGPTASGPVGQSGVDPVLRLASISRELAANDYQQLGFNSKGPGEALDRNVELVITSPFAQPARAVRLGALWLPRSPGQVAGALATAGAAAIIRRRMRIAESRTLPDRAR